MRIYADLWMVDRIRMAIAYFTTKGYTVSIPLNDTQDYDLVIEKCNKLYTVQVKATGCKTKYNVYCEKSKNVI